MNPHFSVYKPKKKQDSSLQFLKKEFSATVFLNENYKYTLQCLRDFLEDKTMEEDWDEEEEEEEEDEEW